MLLLAGSAPLPAAPQQAAPAESADPSAATRKEMQDAGAELAKVKLDIAVEPAFHFAA